jgi:ribosomal subunit interface protein
VKKRGGIMIQITIRGIPASKLLETHIRQKIEKLDRYNKQITSARVVVELPQKHKHQGKLYNVRIDILVPGKELVVTHKQDEDVYIAIRDAFEAIERQLEEHSRKRHGRVKTHEDVLHGHIARILPLEGYGFIEGKDGNEYYFSMTNVNHPHFDQLMIGDAVVYTAQPFSEGWQANRISKERHNNH